MTKNDLVITRLHLLQPLAVERILMMLVNLASDRRSPGLVFELRAEHNPATKTSPGVGGPSVTHLVGCPAHALSRVKRVITDHVPGVGFTGVDQRPQMSEVGRMALRPTVMPLRTDDPEGVTRALLSAMAVRLRTGEALVIQIVLGPRRPPHPLHPEAPAPDSRWWHQLLYGTTAASTEQRKSLRVRAEDAGFDAIVRVGAASPDPDRARRLIVGLQSALSTARAPGVRMEFIREDPKVVSDVVVPRRFPYQLACSELVGLLAWPLGNDELPGVPALHPKPVRPSTAVHSKERVFASSLAPGDTRQIGIAAKDALFHGVAYGPSGSGKSTAFLNLIVADMKAGRPIAVLDPKKQLISDILARVPAERIDDVVVLDVGDEQSVGFNPLDVTGRDPDVVVDGIMSVFGSLFHDGFGPRSLDIFSGALRTLARASVGGSPATLVDMPRILTDPTFRRHQIARVAHDEALAGFWAWFESQSPAAQAAALAAPLNKLRQLLLRPALVRMLDQPQARFQLRNVWRENKIVLVPLNEGLIGSGTASLLGSLIVADLAQAVLERASEQHPERRPGMVYIDEAPRFLSADSLADSLAISRSLGVGWFLVAQYRGQFSQELRSAIDLNARSKVAWATEYDDATWFAKTAKNLVAEDFMALKRFQAYANLVADGHPQGWALVQTLPPPPVTVRPERVIARSRAQWGLAASRPHTEAQNPHEPLDSGGPADSGSADSGPADSGPGDASTGSVRQSGPAPALPVPGELRIGRQRRRT